MSQNSAFDVPSSWESTSSTPINPLHGVMDGFSSDIFQFAEDQRITNIPDVKGPSGVANPGLPSVLSYLKNIFERSERRVHANLRRNLPHFVFPKIASVTTLPLVDTRLRGVTREQLTRACITKLESEVPQIRYYGEPLPLDWIKEMFQECISYVGTMKISSCSGEKSDFNRHDFILYVPANPGHSTKPGWTKLRFTYMGKLPIVKGIPAFRYLPYTHPNTPGVEGLIQFWKEKAGVEVSTEGVISLSLRDDNAVEMVRDYYPYFPYSDWLRRTIDFNYFTNLRNLGEIFDWMERDPLLTKQSIGVQRVGASYEVVAPDSDPFAYAFQHYIASQSGQGNMCYGYGDKVKVLKRKILPREKYLEPINREYGLVPFMSYFDQQDRANFEVKFLTDVSQFLGVTQVQVLERVAERRISIDALIDLGVGKAVEVLSV